MQRRRRPSRNCPPPAPRENHGRFALALLQADNDTKRVHGCVYFEQADVTRETRVYVSLQGLTPGVSHAFHIHEYGDARRCCESMGGHFNPNGKLHGSQTWHDVERHAGDLINNLPPAGSDGAVQLAFTDPLITLFGDDCIYGCSIVVHQGTDDLGLGGTCESLKTGSAGKRIGCAPIVRCKRDDSLRVIA